VPEKLHSAKSLRREKIRRRLFAECNTRRSLRRVYFGLRRVPLALGEESVSSSDSCHLTRASALECSSALVFFVQIETSALTLYDHDLHKLMSIIYHLCLSIRLKHDMLLLSTGFIEYCRATMHLLIQPRTICLLPNCRCLYMIASCCLFCNVTSTEKQRDGTTLERGWIQKLVAVAANVACL
jgi:hypothetical protein